MEKENVKNKGQVGMVQLVSWGLTLAMASIGFTMSQFSKISDAQTSVVQRISVVETQSTQYEKDITEINKKLDVLISQKYK